MEKQPQKKKSGWFENPDESGKAPEHKKAADRNNMVGVLRRPMVRVKKSKKPNRYWTDEIIIRELEKIRDNIGRFPSEQKLKVIKRNDLLGAINTHGGINKFRKLLGGELTQAPTGYWTDKKILEKLKVIITTTGHFPKQTELIELERHDLLRAIFRHGGSNKFRALLGKEIIKSSTKDWSDEEIIKRLKTIITPTGHLPTQKELSVMGKNDLLWAINKNGGIIKFRKLLGEELLQVPVGYWTDETIIDKLKVIIKVTGHFPTYAELVILKRGDLFGAISTHGGINKFRKLLGYSISLHQQYISKSASYSVQRGKNTEEIIKKILIEWCKQNGYPEPIYNKKFSANSVIEFVCGVGKIIGIDVTNTKTRNGNVISQKYRKKDYHKYVDELWIVVFSNIFTERDYHKFNDESPDNVRVMPIDIFLKELDISTDEHLASKIDAYKNCTFRTKDEFIKRHLNRSIEDYV